jgi:hypothetical protein
MKSHQNVDILEEKKNVSHYALTHFKVVTFKVKRNS